MDEFFFLVYLCIYIPCECVRECARESVFLCVSVMMCCCVDRVLQCDAVCCSVLQCAAVCCIVLQCVVVCGSVLQCVAVCCSVPITLCCSIECVLQCVAVCCSVLHLVAVCCSVLQCVAVCCSVLQCVYHVVL